MKSVPFHSCRNLLGKQTSTGGRRRGKPAAFLVSMALRSCPRRRSFAWCFSYSSASFPSCRFRLTLPCTGPLSAAREFHVGPLMPHFDPYDSLVPVFIETEIPKRVHQMGTAIFREMWGEPVLITAAHVTDELKNGVLLVPTVQGLSPIDGYMAYIDLPPEVSRLEDNVDIAYYRLSSEFAAQLSYHFKPLPQGRGEVIQSALELTVCSASGYQDQE